MALTVNPHSALPPALSWDETIVPALRKRLESESRVLSNRMSTASIPSADEAPHPHQTNSAPRTKSSNKTDDTANLSSHNVTSARPKPSAIPRPSLQYSRTQNDEPAGPSQKSQYNYSKPPAQRRPRTYSQPYLFGSGNLNGAHAPLPDNIDSALPTPASSRPTSPTIVGSSRPSDPRNTRIPKASRDSVAGQGQSLPNGHNHRHAESSNHDVYPLTPEISPDFWPSNEDAQSGSQHSTISVLRSQKQLDPGLLHEQPPFSADSFSQSFGDDIDVPPRVSAEEERPFEHWYRGEVSRNGGVGELRVGNRKEMLDIANYGHVLRRPSSRAPTPSSPRSGRRKRADSIGARESLYIDEYDDPRAVTEMVLDEMPLTDIEGDTETDRETSYVVTSRNTNIPSTSPTTNTSRLPAPSRPAQFKRSQRTSPVVTTHAPKSYMRGASSPPDLPPASAPLHALGMPHSQSLSSAQSQKRGRAKSPATPSKRAKTPVAQRKRSKSAYDIRRQEEDSQYPTPPDFPGGMADAIPSWTQPVPKAGNWDEVVLPVVARKMGLEDQYEQADGSPRHRKTDDDNPPPAPGTFGFDHSKYRAYRNDGGGEHVPMDEFGSLPAQSPVEQPAENLEADPTHQRPLSINTNPPVPSFRRREPAPTSPAPFSHYANSQGILEVKDQPGMRLQEATSTQSVSVQKMDDESGGCCKCCVIM